MAKNILLLTFDDDSVLTLRERSAGGFVISYEDREGEETKLVRLDEEIDFDLAKSIFFMVADRWGWDEEFTEDDDDEKDDDDDEDDE